MSTDLIARLEEQNATYWRVRTRVKDTQKKLREKSLLVKKARKITNILLKTGELVRIPCEVCGEEKVDVHHLDYNKPRLVMFLCKKHHVEWHRTNTPLY